MTDATRACLAWAGIGVGVAMIFIAELAYLLRARKERALDDAFQRAGSCDDLD